MSRSNRLANKSKSKKAPGEGFAEMVVAGLMGNAITAIQFSKFPFGNVDLRQCIAKLEAAVGRVHSGDLRETPRPC